MAQTQAAHIEATWVMKHTALGNYFFMINSFAVHASLENNVASWISLYKSYKVWRRFSSMGKSEIIKCHNEDSLTGHLVKKHPSDWCVFFSREVSPGSSSPAEIYLSMPVGEASIILNNWTHIALGELWKAVGEKSQVFRHSLSYQRRDSDRSQGMSHFSLFCSSLPPDHCFPLRCPMCQSPATWSI